MREKAGWVERFTGVPGPLAVAAFWAAVSGFVCVAAVLWPGLPVIQVVRAGLVAVIFLVLAVILALRALSLEGRVPGPAPASHADKPPLRE